MESDVISCTTSKNSTNILITGACVRGERHSKAGIPCQDAWAYISLPGGTGAVAVADGLSSAEHAEEGATIAVKEACESISIAHRNQNFDSDYKELIKDAVKNARQAILSQSQKCNRNSGLYATTLIIAILSKDTITVGHIGDGIVAGVQNGLPVIVSTPGPAEYANETASLTQSDWEENLRITEQKDIHACLIATDGCQGALATRKGAEYIPHAPFINPLLSFIKRKNAEGNDSAPDILNLLQSARMNDLSGDDKTLVIILPTK
jgi:hypothetical protein